VLQTSNELGLLLCDCNGLALVAEVQEGKGTSSDKNDHEEIAKNELASLSGHVKYTFEGSGDDMEEAGDEGEDGIEHPSKEAKDGVEDAGHKLHDGGYEIADGVE